MTDPVPQHTRAVVSTDRGNNGRRRPQGGRRGNQRYHGGWGNGNTVYLKSKKEHVDYLRIVLGVLGKQKLYAKFSKREFRLSSVALLRHVVSKEGMMLKVNERNYPMHDLELAAVVFALKIWRHYLHSVKCEVYADYRSLHYVFT
ncbi:uncharacterized protein LOC129903556 [Solanum dulcamara]|uniref:uncharacterized protein LOC129903556 n=1 Tax=Solanum dulcamara TaxID=45834 RepID=UPI002485A903|nr:uncharacterized protein LOC129903556 [Solanum dulcamara]